MNLRSIRLTKWQKRTLMITVSAVAIFLLYVYLFVPLQFMFNNEIAIELSPTHTYYEITTNSSYEIELQLTAQTPLGCTSTCTYTFEDLSSGDVLYNTTIQQPTQKVFTHTITAPRYGEGELYYRSRATCNAVESKTCRASQRTYHESGLYTVHYTLSEQEQALEQSLQEALSTSTRVTHTAQNKFNYADTILEVTQPVLGDKTIEYTILHSQRRKVNDKLLRLYVEEKQLQDIYRNQNFSSIDTKTVHSFENTTIALSQDIRELNNTLDSFTTDWSRIVDSLQRFKQYGPSLQQSYEYALHIEDEELSTTAQAIDTNVTQYLEEELFNKPHSLSQMAQQGQKLARELSLFVNTTTSILTDAREALHSSNEQGIQLIEIYNGDIYPESILSTDVCRDKEFVNSLLDSYNTKAELYQDTYTINESLLTTECIGLQQHVLDEGTLTTYTIDENVLLNTTVPVSQETLKTLCTINTTHLYEESDLAYCTLSDDEDIFVDQLFYDLVDRLPSYTPLSYNTTIDTPSSQCCVYGNCQSCCLQSSTNCTSPTPVLFLHGHALSKSNNPRTSLSAFSPLQETMHDDGFIDAGVISQEGAITNLPEQAWANIPAPITLRASYYFITDYTVGQETFTVQKTDKIENYALRLDEIIRLVQDKTGSQKVTLVTHSMGGLVAREYIRIFGEESVEHLIMIGTPNRGIEGSVQKYCDVTGASKECNDMRKDSIFLSRLNVQQDSFHSTNAVTIRAVGCNQSGEQGDGVVLSKQVPLNSTTNYLINGSCTESAFDDTLHSLLLDPSKYPEVYDIILQEITS